MSKFSYDCSKCAAFCCIALGYEKSDQFPYDKPQNERCKNLNSCDECTIHDQLEDQSYHGCIAFSCHGAGPHLVKCYSKIDWKKNPQLTEEVYDKFHFLRAVFQIADVTCEALKTQNINPKGLAKEFFKMVATRQKIPMISDTKAVNDFTEAWNQKTRDFISRNA